MVVVLNESDFVNNKFTVSYGGNKEALFTIVDEEFAGMGTSGRVNMITILVRNLNTDGSVASASRQWGVIGIGNGIAGVRTAIPSLRGQVLSKDNMSQCEVLLYEAEGV